MQRECDKLILESLNKSYIDKDEYPVATELQDQRSSMIAHLFNPHLEGGEQAVGAGRITYCYNVGRFHKNKKKCWQLKCKAHGQPYDK
eukprot:c47958_g1_i1 orf=2-262(-)